MTRFQHPLLLAMPFLLLSGCTTFDDPNYTYWKQATTESKPVSDQVSSRSGSAPSQAASGNSKATMPAANSTSVPVGQSAVVPVDSPAVPQTAPSAQ